MPVIVDTNELKGKLITTLECRDRLKYPKAEFFAVHLDYLRPAVFHVDDRNRVQLWRQSVRGGPPSVEVDLAQRNHLFTLTSFLPHENQWPYVNHRNFREGRKRTLDFGGFNFGDFDSIVVSID